MPNRVDPQKNRLPMPSTPGNRPTPNAADVADVLARVYALILSWPTAEEKRAQQQQGDNPS
mgnify:CR=1 FL=1